MQAFKCAMFALNISSPINYVIRLKGKYRQHVRGTKRVKLNTNIINGGLWLHYHKQRGIGNWKKAISTFDGLLARHYHYHLVCCVRQFSNKNQFWNNSLPGEFVALGNCGGNYVHRFICIFHQVLRERQPS